MKHSASPGSEYHTKRIFQTHILVHVFPLPPAAQYLLGDLEDSQESDTTEHRHPEGRHDLRGGEDNLGDAADHHKAVKTVEQRYKVALQSQG